MKIAILLCGQLRTFDMCKWNVKHTLQDRYDCDVFMSIDKNNLHQHENLNSKNDTNTQDIQSAVNFIKPIKYYIVDDIAFNKDYNLFNIDEKTIYPKYNHTIDNPNLIKNSILESDFSNSEYLKFKTPYFKTENMQYSTFNKENYIKVLRQYFIVNECYKMLVEHISNTGTRYDLIIKLRFDQLIWTDGYNLLLMCKEVNEYGPLYNERNIDIIKENTLGITLNLDHSEENTINVFGGGIIKTYGYVNDQFWLHGMDLIHKMGQFYNTMFGIINKIHREHMPYSGGNIEHIFLRFLFDNNIKIKKTIIKGRFIREFSNK
jgi:hypothetical protein